MSENEARHAAYSRIATIIFALVVLALSFLVVRPFLVALLSAGALAYIFYPVYKALAQRLPAGPPRAVIASALTCLLICLIVLFPVVFVTVTLAGEARAGYAFLQQFMAGPALNLNFPFPFAELFGNLTPVKELVLDLSGTAIDWLQGALKTIPNIALNIFITIFSTYYFLKHGGDLYRLLQEFVPLPAGRYQQIIARFDDLSRGVIMGQVVVGLVQGVLAWLGFVIIGLPNPVLWGFLTAIISIIPLLGAALVWFPIFLVLLAQGIYFGGVWRAVFLFFYGVFVVSLIDNLLKPKIVGGHAKIHPLIVLIGILGGLQLFGLPGILIGPLVLTCFDLMVEIYKETL
ncbi:MAG: AI-2E family transporter [Candidatus Saganbacteria bacterium]|nr:AI-2E family transporter [Candidatus Saganbacteria bacterium]